VDSVHDLYYGKEQEKKNRGGSVVSYILL